MSEWHGWERGTIKAERAAPRLHIGPLPGRKQVALYEQDGAVLRTLAFFPTEAQAVRTMDLLDYVAFGDEKALKRLRAAAEQGEPNGET